jgi:lipoate-protein ligase A
MKCARRVKVPGGKLVVVDLDLDDGRLRDVRVSGDFFLEPDDALERMIAHFRKRYGLVDDVLTPAELSQAADLAATKFATPEWTARVP